MCSSRVCLCWYGEVSIYEVSFISPKTLSSYDDHAHLPTCLDRQTPKDLRANDLLSLLYSGNQCYCDNAISNGGTSAVATSCASPCAGNNAEICGGSNFLSLYTTAPPTWQLQGCYTDVPIARTLSNSYNIAALTQEKCQATCQTNGFKYAGVEL